MNKYQPTLAIIIAIIGFILLAMDLINAQIHMRGADSIAGAILLGSGIIALQRKQ